MPTLEPVKIVFFGVDKVSKDFNKLFKNINTVGRTTKQVGTKLSTHLTLPVIGLGIAIGKIAGEFEASMNKVEALSQASGTEIKNLTDLAKDLGIKTRYSAKEAADGMGFLAQAGFNAADIMTAMPDVLDLTTASGLELGRSADVLSNIMGAFELDVSKTTNTTDILASVIASSNVDLEMLAETLKMSGSIAKQFGDDVKGAVTIAGFLGNIGLQGTVAGTALKNIYAILASPPKKAAETFDLLGIRTKDFKGNLLAVDVVFKNLGKKLATLSSSKRLGHITKIFGKIPLAATAALSSDLGKVNSKFLQLAKKMEIVEGRNKSIAAIMNRGLVGAVKSMQSALEGLALAIADSGLLQFLTNSAKSLAGFIRNLTKTNPVMLKTITVLAAGAAALGPLLIVLGSLVSTIGILGPKIAALGGVGAVFGSIIVPITAVVGTLMTLFYILKPYTTELKIGFLTVWESVKDTFSELAPLLTYIAGGTKDVTNGFRPIIPLFIEFAALNIVGILHVIGMVFKGWALLLPPIVELLGAMIEKIAQLTEMILPEWLINMMTGGPIEFKLPTETQAMLDDMPLGDQAVQESTAGFGDIASALKTGQSYRTPTQKVEVEFKNKPGPLKVTTNDGITEDLDLGPIM